jgi:hypothetical protein
MRTFVADFLFLWCEPPASLEGRTAFPNNELKRFR